MVKCTIIRIFATCTLAFAFNSLICDYEDARYINKCGMSMCT